LFLQSVAGGETGSSLCKQLLPRTPKGSKPDGTIRDDAAGVKSDNWTNKTEKRREWRSVDGAVKAGNTL